MSRVLATALLTILALARVPPSAAAQDAVRDVSLSADTIGLGDLFDLRFTLVLGPGEVAFLPDSLETADFESFAAVEWSASETPGGGREISVTYPLIAFQVGPVDIPDIVFFVAPTGESVRADVAQTGEPVGSWDAFVEEPARVPSARLASVPAQRVHVTSVLVIDEMTEGIRPRPAMDVVGASRDWSSTLLAVLFATIFLGAVTVLVREWRAAARRQAMTEVLPDPRAVAIEALDALLAAGLHRVGRVRDFYERSSTIVRRYVEGFESTWGPAWTSTELMTDLERRRPGAPAGPLPEEMSSAERVKFGGERPGAEAAEAHWSSVRRWVATTGAVSDPDDDGDPR